MSPEELAELTAGGVFDPDTPYAAERIEVLELLLAHGATIDELRDARGDFGALAARLVLRPSRPSLTRAQLAARVGVSADLVMRMWRAAGFADAGPDAPVASDDDVPMFQTFATATEIFGTDTVLQLTRAVGSAMARLADTFVSAFIANMLPAAADADATGLAVVRANLDALVFLPPLLDAMDKLLRQHMVAAQRTGGSTANPTRYELQTITVGFLDLVDSTTLARQLPIGELGAAIGEFEQRATDAVVQRGGRVIKLIGDEVMFTAPRPLAACTIACEIRDTFRDHPVLPGVRGGLASGQVLLRDGDCFGPVVNLAARLVKEASPGEIVVDQVVADALDDGYASYRPQPLGTRLLKGFDQAVAVCRLMDPASAPNHRDT